MLRKLFLLTSILIGATLVVFSIHFYVFLQNPLKVGESGHVVIIPQGSSVHLIAKQLSNEKIIDSALCFMLAVRLQGAWSQLKAGEYLIKPETKPVQLIDQIQHGKVMQHALTIVPGWTFERLMQEIKQCSTIKHTLDGLKPIEIMDKLGNTGVHPEGQFFPETYHFTRDTSDLVFLQRAHQLLQKKLQGAWESKMQPLPLQSPYEVLILASIIEKESSIADEYGDISAVFVKRLGLKMPLQADPTVIYGAGDTYKGVITRDMLSFASPYNTYRILGLPPTPIAMPSERALFAATHPNSVDYLYFVAKKNGKGHVFSKTLAEHQAAVNEYRAAALGNQ